ncbi:MAG: nitrilase-related carbon-nitrogen hydrolase [Pseudomonadota bacterium]
MTPRSLTKRSFIAGSAAASLFASSGYAAKGSDRYSALALQTLCDAVNQDKDKATARQRMLRSIARIEKQIAVAQAFFQGYSGYPLKLVVLPEYVLTGFPLGETRAEWRDKAAIGKTGEILDAWSAVAQRQKVFLCTNHYETDPKFPDLYFQANVVVAPNGDVVLRYRRMISLYAPTPYDVWDAYLDAYGLDAVFPVAKTEIGTLGTIASEEILYPEIARMHALKGAELLLHPTAEVGAPMLTVKDIAKRARAIENMAYVVSANTGGMSGTPVPQASTDAMSKIIDWYGKVLAEAGYGESMNAVATIDLDGLRSARSNTGMANMLSRLPMDAFEPGYAAAEHYGPNRLSDGKMQGRKEALGAQRKVIEGLRERGVFEE